VDLQIEQDQLIIRPLTKTREGWAKAFEDMARQGDDQLVETETTPSQWDGTEWTW